MLLAVLAVTLGFCLLARVPCLVACQPGASAIHALVQPLETILSTVQHWSLALYVGDRGIATVVGQDVEVLLTEVGFQLTTFSQSLSMIRDAVPLVRNAVPLVSKAVSLVRKAVSLVSDAVSLVRDAVPPFQAVTA